MKFEVVGIDCPCVDLAVNVDVYPDSNGAEQIQNISWQGGGKVATGIVAAARLGAKGAVLGAVGDDSYGKFVDEDFIHHGLDTSYLKKREGKTTNFDIVLSNRETMGRCILYYPGTAEQLQAEELPLEYLTNTTYLFISMLEQKSLLMQIPTLKNCVR